MHVAYLSRELATRGHEVHVLHSIDAFNLKERNRQLEPQGNDGIHVHPCRSPLGILSPLSAYALGKSPHVSKRFDSIVKSVSPDVVHHHNISLLGIDILRRRRSYLNVYTAHDYWLLCLRNDMLFKGGRICTTCDCVSCGLSSRRIRQPWRRLSQLQSFLRELDTIIAPSKFLQTLLSQRFNNGVSQIYNFAPEPPKETLDVGLDNFFLFAGVLEEHKGVRLLLDAFEKAEVDSGLVIVGDGTLRHYAEERAVTGSLRGRVHILGRVDQHYLYGLYARAMALVLPSICLENCPLVVLEALSMGAPVLGSRTGGIGEIVRLSGGGLVLDPNSTEAKDCLEHIATDVPSRARFSSNAKDAYAKWFSPKAFMKAYEYEIDNMALA